MTGKGELSIFGNGKAAADFAVEKWVGACTDSIENKGYFTTALSGGKTPIDFYKLLSAGGKELPWAKIHLFLADERFVPATDKESNYRLVRECLLNHVNIPKNNVHRIDTEEATLEMAAEKYEEEIRNFFGIEGDHIPEFNLIILGIGEDGHTASLFPEAPSLKEKKRIYEDKGKKSNRMHGTRSGVPIKPMVRSRPECLCSRLLIFELSAISR